MNQVVTMVTGLCLTPFLIRAIGTDSYGAWLGSMQIIALLGMIDFGMSVLFVREIAGVSARPASMRRDVKCGRLVDSYVMMSLIQLPFVLAGSLLAWRLLPAAMASRIDVCLFVFSVYFFSFFLKFFTSLLIGLQDMFWLGRWQFVTSILNTTVTYFLAINNYGIIALAAGWSIGEILIPLVAIVRLRNHYPFVFRKVRGRFRKVGIVKYLKRGRWMMIGQISHILTSSHDLSLIAKLSGVTQVSVYSMTSKLFVIGNNIPNQVINVATPTMFQIVSAEKKSEFIRVFSAVTLATVLVSGFLACTITSVNSQFIPWWVGADLFGGKALTAAIAINLIVRHFAACAAFGSLWIGNDRDSVTGTLVGAIASILLGIPLTYFWGSLGTVWANTLAAACVATPLSLIHFSRALKVPLRSIFQPLAGWAWRAAIAMIVSYWISLGPVSLGIVGIAAKASLSVIFYLALMRPILTGDYLGHYFVPRFRKLLPKSLRRRVHPPHAHAHAHAPKHHEKHHEKAHAQS